MSPNRLGEAVLRDAPVIRAEDDVGAAVRAVFDSELPALPVVDADDRLVGIFGEREFFEALFPGYLKTLSSVGFLPRTLEETLLKRRPSEEGPVSRFMNAERVNVPREYSDARVAEIFLHHRVLIVPVTEGARVVGVVTRSDFFRVLAERFLDEGPRG